MYYGDKQVAAADVYYQQADAIAAGIPDGLDDAKIEWMPLGVFAVTQEDAVDNGMIVQLAVSKEGIIAGTYYNELSGSERPLEGTVDQKTQRAAWKFADGKNVGVVFETGIYNLTKDETTMLVHFSADKTQTWHMVRLPAPADSADGAAPTER
ncbi:MAG: hypothetical protein KDA41_12540 [Planctomycetales bacterium]|nr:hypothetical protein [Planctomycetales bacterium]